MLTSSDSSTKARLNCKKGKERVDLQVANIEAKETLINEEEKRMQKELQHFEEIEELHNQNKELQTMAHHHLHMWKNSEEQRARLPDSYNHLQVEALIDIKLQRNILMKESDDRAANLSRSYKQELQILATKAANLKSTCEHIVRQR